MPDFGTMKPEVFFGIVIALFFTVPFAIKLLIWICDVLERAMKTMAGNDDGR